MTPQESGVEIKANALRLDGHILDAEIHSRRDIAYVLGVLGRSAIVAHIENKYSHTAHKYPGGSVSRPSLLVMNLGSDTKSVLTDWGQHSRTNIHRSIIEVQPGFQDHWQTIIHSDLTPEVRSAMGNRSHSQNWLMLRNPDTDPRPITPLDHLPQAMGFIEPAIVRDVKPKLFEALRSDDADSYKYYYDILIDGYNEAVDRQTDTYGNSFRAPAQIGLMISLAKLGVELLGDDYLLSDSTEYGYLCHLKDARNYAYNMDMDDVDALLATEIRRVQELR